MGSDETPIHSAYDDDPEHAETIEAFVVALAERIDELQDLDARGELSRLAARAQQLGAAAQAAGFPRLHGSAGDVAAAAGERNAEIAHKALVELTLLAQRVRRGHRGSL